MTKSAQNNHSAIDWRMKIHFDSTLVTSIWKKKKIAWAH